MATSKTLTPTNVTISIPEMTDQPNASVFSNCVDKEADAINSLNSKIQNENLGTYSTSSTFDAKIIEAIGTATADNVKLVTITHSFTSDPFSYAVYKGFILKGAGTGTNAGLILTDGSKIITGYYDGSSISWKGDSKRTAMMSQTITVTTGESGGVQISNFTNYDSSKDIPLSVTVTDSNASYWGALKTTSNGKPNWISVFNGLNSAVSSTSVSMTLFWMRYV